MWVMLQFCQNNSFLGIQRPRDRVVKIMPQLSSDVQSNQAWYIMILYWLDKLFIPKMEAFPYYMIKAACNYKQACISLFDN